MRVSRRSFLATAAATAALPALPAFAADDPAVPRPDEEHRIPVQGGEVYVRINGDLKSGKTPLLLVHGGPGGACWQMFPALPFAADRAVILYDQLDSGRSSAPGDPANWTIDRYRSEIESIRLALDLHEVHLLGHSWGGILVANHAAGQASGIRSVILQGTPMSARGWASSMDELLAAMPDGQGRLISHPSAADDPNKVAAAFTAFMATHLNRTRSPAYARAYMRDVPVDRGDALAAAAMGDGIPRMTGFLRDFDQEPLLRMLTYPTLLLGGQYDLVTPATNRALLPRLQKGSVATLADAGHMAQFDQPEAWRQAVGDFIARAD